ncbi:MAG TPA: PEP-CTERM sorting domain-containing protein [Candidatus Limnocylindria bacterium]|jgi:subtilisin-like proprotein convertase family protein|nr:PEP-CTERM sorting domain-containing protein [Candidatus Limnocylindria bacterium]
MNHLPIAAGLALAASAQAGVVITSGTLDTPIPDDTSTGLALPLNVVDSGTVTSVTVSLNLSVPSGQTGWFGDLYAYVQHGAAISVLLARPGATDSNPFGYDDNQTVSVTFADNAANGDIHTYRTTLNGSESSPLTGPLTGSWAPDGRTTDPATTVAADPRMAPLSGLNGAQATGTWTLFLADLSGGNRYQINNWGMTITTVPEPGWAMGTAGLLLGCWALRRRC